MNRIGARLGDGVDDAARTFPLYSAEEVLGEDLKLLDRIHT